MKHHTAASSSEHVHKLMGKDHHMEHMPHVKVLMRGHHADGGRSGVPTNGPHFGPHFKKGGKCHFADGGDTMENGPKPYAAGGAAKVRRGMMTPTGKIIKNY